MIPQHALNCKPDLNKEQVAYLQAFANKRKLVRDNNILANYSDPLRIAVGLPLGVDGEYYVGECYTPIDPSIVLFDHPNSQPDYFCAWQPSADGQQMITRNDKNTFYLNHDTWIVYINDHFLKPWGIVLQGTVENHKNWDGELGFIVANGFIETYTAKEYEALKQAQYQHQHITANLTAKPSVKRTSKL